MTTTNESLSGVDLAVAAAEEVMGWPIRTVIHQGDGTFVFISEADGRLKKCVREDDYCTMEHWEPWRDPRAWWEIVEKMALSGYAFCLHNQDDNDMWDAAFVDEHGGIHATAQTPGEAVMLAALAAKRTQA